MTFASWVNGIVGALNTIAVPIIFALAFISFLWGIVSYFFLHAADDAKRAEGRAFMLWGVLGMVVLFAVWGIINMLLSTLGIAPGA